MTVKHTINTQKSKKSWFRNFWKSPVRILIAAVVLICLVGSGWLVYLTQSLPTFEQLENYSPELATKVYSADGVLLKEFFTEKRVYTPLSNIPPMLTLAVLSTEDHRFYDHWGISPFRLILVTGKYLFTHSKEQGASTLTQQLARRLYLTPEKTVSRKIKEILTSIQLERTYTKPEILEMYMNHMSFAHGTYGVEAAALHFFNKKLSELTIAECALMAGMLQRPAALNPYRYLDRALHRRKLVLTRMYTENIITEQEFNDANQEEIKLVEHGKDYNLGIAPYFTEYIRQNLQKKYGWDLYKGGMKVYTTLDTRVQACAERAIANHLPNLQKVVNYNMRRKKNFSYLVPPSLLKEQTLEQLMQNKALVDSLISEKCRVQVAFVALDPRDGHILSMVGGRDFMESQFNRAVQAIRQPGSIFKPIVYTAVVDNGYMPYYEKLNQPIVVHMADGSRWTPRNYDGSIGGKTTMREALRRSLNLVTARIVQEDIPPEQVIRYARNLGITTPLDAVDAIALGAVGVIPIEIISAFGVFANKGILVDPISVLRVEDKYSNVLEKSIPQSKGVLREETAYILADLLKTVASAGTGAASRSVYKFMRPAGGKTGTTNDFTDAWYVTFTPQMVAGVWVGLDDPVMSLGEKQSGARAALPITAPFFKAAHDTLHLPVMDFERPEGIVDVEICSDTKLLATPFCPNVIKEIADVRHVPTMSCDEHTGEQNNTQGSDIRRRGKRRIGL